ncbi:MAG: TlpA family protein disulfide reductase [Proteobacteria bacterium]|nr:TlpA family protein disulfide reductase [Pseudomonadota bacterium]
MALQTPAGTDVSRLAEDARQPLGLSALPVPRAVPDLAFEDAMGATHTLAEFRGKAVLLNVWATWCAPCRKEMPALDRLQAKLGGGASQVVSLSIDREGAPIVKHFYEETKIRSLPIFVDRNGDAMDKLHIVGVPTTLLIDAKGGEVARYIGPAEWDWPDVIAMVERYLRLGKG